jgi:hypothetical protein
MGELFSFYNICFQIVYEKIISNFYFRPNYLFSFFFSPSPLAAALLHPHPHDDPA